MYRGYVDDPRNTDNAWIETVALHFHDDKGDQVRAGAPPPQVAALPLHAGDDAAAICWMELTSEIKLYARCRDEDTRNSSLGLSIVCPLPPSHRALVRAAVERLGAHW